MADFDLSSMSIAELKTLQRDVDKAISGFMDTRRSNALAAAQKVANEYGFSLLELADMAGKGRAKRGAASVKPKGIAKYAHPDGRTWTGHGRKPLWIHEAESAGRDITDFAV